VQPVDPMLRWEEVAEMRRLGMTIGAHTLTHPNLPSAGPRMAREEIAGSKKRLEQQLGEPITLFSYPNGGAERYYTEDIQRAVAECGFRAATTSRNGFADAASDVYALERIEVEERLEDLVFALEVERFLFAPTA
jgi:peptidoglycan/xylan/chitin deacetylase (PgdA/CDA1 family)